MAKKKARKKHQFKHVTSKAAGPAGSGIPTPTVSSGAGTPPPPSPAAAKASPAAPADAAHAYVSKDLKRVVVIGAGFAGLQLVLWYLLNSTELGEKVYSLIKL